MHLTTQICNQQKFYSKKIAPSNVQIIIIIWRRLKNKMPSHDSKRNYTVCMWALYLSWTLIKKKILLFVMHFPGKMKRKPYHYWKTFLFDNNNGKFFVLSLWLLPVVAKFVSFLKNTHEKQTYYIQTRTSQTKNVTKVFHMHKHNCFTSTSVRGNVLVNTGMSHQWEALE